MKQPKLMAVDFDRESWPFFVYQQVPALFNPMILNIPIQAGYYYSIERLNASWSSQSTALAGAYADPIRIEAFIESGQKWLQLFPYDLALVSSPGDSGIAVDLTNAARPMTATPLNRSERQTVLARFYDVLTIRISNYSVIASPPNADLSLPSYIDLLIIGRLYPAKSLPGWGENV